MAKLMVVGVGPGSADYVTLAARMAVQKAEIIIGAERSLRLFKEDIGGATQILTAKNLDDLLQYAVESAKNGKIVAVLSTGDPGFSGLLGSILKRFSDKAVELEVVPGVSAVQVCAAKIGISWDNAVWFTFHDETNNEKKVELAETVKAGKVVFLLPQPKVFPPAEIASYLIRIGAHPQTSVTVCENLTLENEKIVKTTLAEASERNFSPQSVMVIRSQVTE